MKIPRPDDDSQKFFHSVLPDDPSVTVRPMFGNEAAFVNGNMFMGLFGSGMFVRLSEEDRAEFLKRKNAALFEPMKGRPMKEYVMIPEEWRGSSEAVRPWVARSLKWAGKLPKKVKK
jgi:TfoX/Sxy family transcriptional regulator of competence genes